jgi:hypothetical protein
MSSTGEVQVSAWGPLCEPLHLDRAAEIDPDGPSWRENAFFTFWDRDAGFYGQVHVTTSPNAGGRKARCHLVFDGDLLEIVEPLEPMSFRSESIEVDLDGRVTVRCHFELDLTVTPRFEHADYSASDTVPSLVAGEPLQHFQRGGTFEARLRVDGSERSFSGHAFRDRTWGFREDTHWLEYYGFMCCFDDFDLTFLKFLAPGDDRRARGFLMGSRQGEIVETLVTERDSLGAIRGVDLTLAGGDVLHATFGESEARPVFVPAGNPSGATAVTIYDLMQPLRIDGSDGEGLGFVEQAILRQLA